MKVVVIDEWLPWPLESGKKIRTYNLMVRLAKNISILYLAYVKIPQEKEKINVLEKNGIHVIPVDDLRIKKWSMLFYLEVILNYFSKDPFSTAYHIKRNFIDKLLEITSREKPDLVHCEWTNLAPFLGFLKNFPKVIAAHNVESDIWKRLAVNEKNPVTCLIARQQEKKIERLEREWYQKADHCIAVSHQDKRVIESYGAKVSVVDNGVDVQYYSEGGPHEFNENRLMFVGSLDTFSNQDAVSFFVNKIFPLIIERFPDIEFWIVGKDPPKKIVGYSKKVTNIFVTGRVQDIREYLSKATLFIVPLRIGGGSRLKILEAMAVKKPVISTSIGAEGLKIVDGENIIIADSPIEFANKVLWLLKNPEKQKSLGKAGWRMVKEEYDWEILAKRQESIWHGVIRN